MIKEIQYTNIRRVLDNLHEHPLLRDVTLEQAVRYTIRFISLHGYPKMFQEKQNRIDIHEFRGLLPCDLISILQVRDAHTKVCLRAMTNSFVPGIDIENKKDRADKPLSQKKEKKEVFSSQYDPFYHRPYHYYEEPSFKTQGRIIFTSFPEGCLELAYKAIPVDEDGFPLLIDNENYLAALEAFIKLQVFTIKFDTGKISAGILQNTQQDYAWRAAELGSEFNTPSVSEAESLSRFWNTLVVSVHQFDEGFRHLGDREYLRRH